jgi:hypothetical protein
LPSVEKKGAWLGERMRTFDFWPNDVHSIDLGPNYVGQYFTVMVVLIPGEGSIVDIIHETRNIADRPDMVQANKAINSPIFFISSMNLSIVGNPSIWQANWVSSSPNFVAPKYNNQVFELAKSSKMA